MRVRHGAVVVLALASLLTRTGPARALPGPFTDATAGAGLVYDHGYVDGGTDEPRRVAGGVACGDYDGDGWLDLYAVRGDIGPNLLFRNRGDGTFEEVGTAAGVGFLGDRNAGPVFADYDGDGHVDLLVLGIGATKARLFRNRGDGTFADVTAASGLAVTRNSYSAAFGDVDRDGDLDLVVTHWLTDVDDTPGEHFWRNRGDGTFEEASAAAGIIGFTSPRFPYDLDLTFTPNLADLDDDGWPDLLFASDFATSRVFRNDRTGVFQETTTPVISDENGMGGAVGDYDGDGDLDWFVSSIWDDDGVAEGNWSVSGNRLYQNTGDGTFVDVTDQAGVRQGGWGWGSTFTDLDLDGHLDLVHVNGWESDNEGVAPFRTDATRVFVANGDGTFTDYAPAIGIVDTGQGRGVVAFDADRDGDVDLFLANNQQPPRFFRNDLAAPRRFLVVRLRGRAPNTQAIGARVWITAGGRTQLREVRAGSNFESQDPAEVHVGVGDAMLVDELRIRWPDGTTSTLTDIPVDRFLRIDQPGDGCAADGASCFAGGKSRRRECWLETTLSGALGARGATCTDGDPGCDLDGTANGTCAFGVAFCVAVRDPRFPRCTPDPTVRVDVDAARSSLVTTAVDRLRGIARTLDARPPFVALGDDRCSTRGTVTVGLRRGRSGGIRPGKLAVRATATGNTGVDRDRIVLVCRPQRPSR